MTPIELIAPAVPDYARMVEIDQRAADGIEVRLLWHPTTGEVAVAVFDQRTDEQFAMPVQPDQALDAFRHPFGFRGNH